MMRRIIVRNIILIGERLNNNVKVMPNKSRMMSSKVEEEYQKNFFLFRKYTISLNANNGLIFFTILAP